MSKDPIETPEPYATIIDKVNVLDRRAFEDGAPSPFWRPYIWGELWPNDPPQSDAHLYAVQVTYVSPHVRMRAIGKCKEPMFDEEHRRHVAKLLEDVDPEDRRR